MSDFQPDKPYTVPQISLEQLKESEFACGNLIKEANIAIAKIDGFLSGLPESQIMLANPIYLREALESSEIENINTTLLDVLEQQLRPDGKKTNSQLVVNYYHALMWGQRNVNKLGLIHRLVVGLHDELLPDSAEGYRRLEVYIGDGRGAKRYTPPEAHTIPAHISKWETLVNNKSSVDPLVVAAAAHYMFEAIHPFEDGNGRTGRMLLTLHLMHSKLISAPVVHISQYINANRAEYYRLLRDVTARGELTQFVKYIVKGFALQATHSLQLLQRLQQVRETYQERVRHEVLSVYSAELVQQLFLNPVQTPLRLAEQLGIHRITASKYLRTLHEHGLLEHSRRGRNMFYVNTMMLDAIDSGSKLDLKGGVKSDGGKKS